MPSPNGYAAHGMGQSERGEQAASDEKGRQGAHVSEMQRRRLLSAIVEVLGEHGLEGTTVGRICKRAGVSRRTFYDLFEEREACFLAAFELALERLTERVVPAYASEGRWRERVRAGLVAMLECFDEEPGLARLCLVETLKGQPEVLERRQAVLDVLAAAIDTGRQESRSADPPPLSAESTVGGVISIIYARLPQSDPRPLVGLVNPLMSMIVLPYLGPAAARKELERPPLAETTVAASNGRAGRRPSDPFKDLPIRITFRTARVLSTIGSEPDASNKEIGRAAGVGDQGQMSKLLSRLQKAGLIENHGEGQLRGEANAWQLTARGHDVLRAVTV
jgi:AcrR family transcriptional regulator